MPLSTPYVREHGDLLYIVSPVQLANPTAEEQNGFAFGQDLLAHADMRTERQKHAPNPVIGWLSGQYVEADNPNRNGDKWTAEGLAIARLTPQFMPVTVMHDPRSSVGLIADTRLLVPNANSVPRARIDTALAVWRHRYGEVWEECEDNAKAGTLMQSMECMAASYDCDACGTKYTRLPHGAEEEHWCDHLRGVNGEKAARTLGGVTFTGTGLIFGSRGARGAYPEAFLEVEELAAMHTEFHARGEHRSTRPKPKGSPRTMDIEDRRYQELLAAEAKVKDLESKVADLEPKANKLPEVEKEAEEAEAAKVKAEQERDAEKARADKAEQVAAETTLREERFEKFGSGFIARLDKAPRTKKTLTEQAGTLDDDAWKARVEELEESFAIKADANADGKEGEGEGKKGEGKDGEEEHAQEFSAAEAAAAGFGGGAPSMTDRAQQSTVGGLGSLFAKSGA